MPHIDQIEKVTLNRVIKFFVDNLHYTYLGDLHDSETAISCSSVSMPIWRLRADIRTSCLVGRLMSLCTQRAISRTGCMMPTKRFTVCSYTVPRSLKKREKHLKLCSFLTFLILHRMTLPLPRSFCSVVGENTKRPDLVIYVNGIALIRSWYLKAWIPWALHWAKAIRFAISSYASLLKRGAICRTINNSITRAALHRYHRSEPLLCYVVSLILSHALSHTPSLSA